MPIPIPRRAPVRIPALLPLGLCIAACHVGWYRDDGLIRCDDYLAVRDDPRVELVVATTPALEACRPGDRLHVSRYPRKVWEAPDGGRMIVTTQEGDPASAAAGRDVPARFDGPVCETWPDPARAPHCLGRGKAHHIVDAPALDGLYVTTWRMPDQGAASTTYELSRTEPMTVLFERTYPDTVGPGWYDPRAGVFEGLDDVGLEILTMRPSDLEIVARREMPAGNSDQWHYDADREEGLLCLALLWTRPIDGEAYLAVAFHGSPPEFRPLGGSGANPLAWVSGVWGCDWDPEARRAWIAVTNLGMIATVDYDTGAVLRWTWVGLGGMRQVAYDRQRRRLFVANFHGGRVTALDPETGDEVAHWFAGRFVRDLALARDGRSLLVTSNLGVLRIRLDD